MSNTKNIELKKSYLISLIVAFAVVAFCLIAVIINNKNDVHPMLFPLLKGLMVQFHLEKLYKRFL